MTFEREERYIVVKRKGLTAIQETALRAHIARMGIETTESVVVENDWPEYETVWRMLEARCGGRPFVSPLDMLGAFYDDAHAANVAAGWWTDLATGEPKRRNVGEMFILIVTELAEAFDAYVHNAMDDKLPEFPGVGVEIGDVQIRLADFAGALRAGRIVEHSHGTFNPGEDYFLRVKDFAKQYEAIRKTPQAVGEPEIGDYLMPMDVVAMIAAKLEFNANRADHKVENRLKDGGKRT